MASPRESNTPAASPASPGKSNSKSRWGSKSPRGSKSPEGSRSPEEVPSAGPANTMSAPIVADPAFEDHDDEGGFDDDVPSTASVTDSILNFRKLHGRTFGNSKTTEYWAPNDEQQNEGLELTHHFLLLYFDNKLFHAPISDDVQDVLDLGTGTGIWAIDFADQHPTAKVVGTDISPIQPAWVPPNCEFHIDDAQLDWTWPENHFGYIHIRDLYGSISDWSALYKQAFIHLKPGGWFEDQEFDIRCHSDVVGEDPNHVYTQWNDIFSEAGETLGKTFKIGMGSSMIDHMEDAGFVNCVQRRVRIPIGSWASDPKLKEIGDLVYLFVRQSIEGFALFLLTQVMGWKYEECHVLIAKMMNALKQYRRLHPYYEVTYAYGQKPEE